MKKIGYMLGLGLAVVGAFGGTGTLLYTGEYVMAAGVVMLTACAWPKIKDMARDFAEASCDD